MKLQNQLVAIQQEISILQPISSVAITQVNDYNDKRVELYEQGTQLDKDIASYHEHKHHLL